MDPKPELIRHGACVHTQQYVHPPMHVSFSPAIPSSLPSNGNVGVDSQHAHACHAPLQINQTSPGTLPQLEQQRVIHDASPFGLQPSSDVADHLVTNINDKIPIYRHPLFPVLRLLFEKTEMATNSIESIAPGAFDTEIKRFITQMARENKPFFTENQEIDNLVLKTIQVLRIHLLELEKVNELCKDFCTRYITCLKGKLNSENIMKTLDINSTPPTSPNRLLSASSYTESEPSPRQEHVPNEKQIQPKPNESMTRSFSVSQDSLHSSKEANTLPISRSMSVDSALNSPALKMNEIPISDVTSGFLSKKGKAGKRGVLPKAATSVLKGWLFQHLVHPYPTEEEKKELAQQTNLSNLQVNNWFINARRRILQPMLESNSSFLKTNKKTKPQRSAAHKDWTNTIGVYNAYRTEALQNTATQTSSMGLLITPSMVANNNTMLVDLDGHAQTVMVTQPLQFVQVTQVPIQAMSTATYIPLADSHGSVPTSVMATCQQQIVVPLVQDKLQTQPGSFVSSLNSSQINQ